ncbi:fish-egg lectin-like [Ranitomeya imitator]|uniref:fish-egg lectin-like n=1 Tax=Ranitomeya imitator TaxID=111125 RepID=UPI0037E988A0
MSFILSLILLCAGASFVASDFLDISCVLVPGNLRQIDAGAGQVWGVDYQDQIFQLVGDSWQQVPGQLLHVSVGPAGVWGVNRANTVFNLQNNVWTVVPGKVRFHVDYIIADDRLRTGSLNQVDAGGAIYVAGVDAQNNVFCSPSSYTPFSPIDGSLIYYSCGLYGCWGVNSANNIFYREFVTPQACQGVKWQPLAGSLSMLEVGTDGSVYGVNAAGQVFKRLDIFDRAPYGTGWYRFDSCSSIKHVTYDAGFLWLLSQTGDIYKCNEITSTTY